MLIPPGAPAVPAGCNTGRLLAILPAIAAAGRWIRFRGAARILQRPLILPAPPILLFAISPIPAGALAIPAGHKLEALSPKHLPAVAAMGRRFCPKAVLILLPILAQPPQPLRAEALLLRRQIIRLPRLPALIPFLDGVFAIPAGCNTGA